MNWKWKDTVFFIFNLAAGFFIGIYSDTFIDLAFNMSGYVALLIGLVMVLYKFKKIHWIMGVKQ